MSKLIYTVGIPGSGKSYATKEIAKKENAIILSTDDLRMELFGSHTKQKKTSLLFYHLYTRIPPFQGANASKWGMNYFKFLN